MGSREAHSLPSHHEEVFGIDHAESRRKGCKDPYEGSLDGNEIARNEHLSKGSLPLQTLRADIDYGTETAFTTYGTIGIRVWIYKGEVFEKTAKQEDEEAGRARRKPSSNY